MASKLGLCANDECRANIWQNEAGEPAVCDNCQRSGFEKKKGKK